MTKIWRTRLQLVGGFVLILLAAWIVITGGAGGSGTDDGSSTSHSRSAAPSSGSGSTSGASSGQGSGSGQGSTPSSGLATIAESALPAEGQETLGLIRDGGPFPYDRDGITFQNREGILPSQQRGYYSEYTVPTPGLDHRGAKRIVCGEARDCFYTDDHYDSFRQIQEGQ
ncbi:ribonuclease [Janibacter sp. Soil728]|uniref:ribonuclease domain-containing protein n=1 Tax=Janibacter sp. Soil728 TaxID=1736393 RepID=UPI0006FCCA7F|nr:ribonuclease domain-containing protein [Janibacter sp. Soil728]KRE38450.1 ribonuclease [Janibacter sp. Soil728]